MNRFHPWRLAWLNLLRKPGRTLLAGLGVVLAAATAFAGALITTGVHGGLTSGISRLGADLMVVPEGSTAATHNALVVGEPAAFYMDGAVTDKVATVPGVGRAAPQIYVETLASSACCTGRLFLVGFDPDRDFTVKPWLTKLLPEGLHAAQVVVGNHILTPVGELMRFYGTDFTVAARLDGTGMGADETVFLPVQAVRQLVLDSETKAEKPLRIPPGQISSVLVRVENPGSVDEVARRIQAAVPGVSVVTTGDVTRGVTRDLGRLMATLTPVLSGVLLVCLALLVVLFAAVAAERSREVGLMRAMGATERFVVSLLVREAVLLAVAGGLAGALAGAGLFALFQRVITLSYTLPYAWPSLAVQAGLGAATVAGIALLGGLAAWWPTWRLARQDPFYTLHAR